MSGIVINIESDDDTYGNAEVTDHKDGRIEIEYDIPVETEDSDEVSYKKRTAKLHGNKTSYEVLLVEDNDGWFVPEGDELPESLKEELKELGYNIN